MLVLYHPINSVSIMYLFTQLISNSFTQLHSFFKNKVQVRDCINIPVKYSTRRGVASIMALKNVENMKHVEDTVSICILMCLP